VEIDVRQMAPADEDALHHCSDRPMKDQMHERFGKLFGAHGGGKEA